MKFTQKKNLSRDFSKCVVLLSDIKTKLKKDFREIKRISEQKC